MLKGSRILQFNRMCTLFSNQYEAASNTQCYYSFLIPLVKTSLQKLPSSDNYLLQPKNREFRRMFCTEESKAIVFEVQDEDDFSEKVINSSVPVIVDFHADWCGPCKMLGPRIEAIIIGRKGNVKLAKVNVDYATDLAIDYEVNVVPTILAFKAGEVVGRIEGAKSDEELDSFVDTLIE